MSDLDFDWLHDSAVVVPEQMAIAVYSNTAGNLVIRQAGSYPEPDQIVIVGSRDAKALAEPIFAAADVHEIGISEEVPNVTSSAALRQKRYRQRNGGKPKTVTRNGQDRNTPHNALGADDSDNAPSRVTGSGDHITLRAANA
jgi:hypothetical protein